MKLKTSKRITVDCDDWSTLVKETYQRPYNFQQQEGCRDRGTHQFSVPSSHNEDYMHDSIPEIVNGSKMGVKFATWISRDPLTPLNNPKDRNQLSLDLFWGRNFYPDLEVLANDLYSKGLIDAGDYTIVIDW